MNFLAHIFLSGDSPGVLIGNFIGDYVKGRGYLGYPREIKRGILLHRDIDSYTDRHVITRTCKSFVRPKYGKYSGIVVDIYYDHFLASNWTRYSDDPLNKFIRIKYDVLNSYSDLFPEGVQRFFPYFVRSNWLEAYASLEGLESVLRGMAHRTSLPDYSDFAVMRLKENYSILKMESLAFLDDVIEFVRKEHSIIL